MSKKYSFSKQDVFTILKYIGYIGTSALLANASGIYNLAIQYIDPQIAVLLASIVGVAAKKFLEDNPIANKN